MTTFGLGGVLGDGLAGGGVGTTIDGAVVGAVDAPQLQAAMNAPKPAIAEPCRKPRRVIGRVPPVDSSNMSSSSTPPDTAARLRVQLSPVSPPGASCTTNE